MLIHRLVEQIERRKTGLSSFTLNSVAGKDWENGEIYLDSFYVGKNLLKKIGVGRDSVYFTKASKLRNLTFGDYKNWGDSFIYGRKFKVGKDILSNPLIDGTYGFIKFWDRTKLVIIPVSLFGTIATKANSLRRFKPPDICSIDVGSLVEVEVHGNSRFILLKW